jgi:hypothetical protein
MGRRPWPGTGLAGNPLSRSIRRSWAFRAIGNEFASFGGPYDRKRPNTTQKMIVLGNLFCLK